MFCCHEPAEGQTEQADPSGRLHRRPRPRLQTSRKLPQMFRDVEARREGRCGGGRSEESDVKVKHPNMSSGQVRTEPQEDLLEETGSPIQVDPSRLKWDSHSIKIPSRRFLPVRIFHKQEVKRLEVRGHRSQGSKHNNPDKHC